MAISTQQIADLRAKSGAGILASREALTATNGNVEEALVWLRKKGLADVKGREARTANEGTIGVYVHNGSRMAVLCEISSETDFVSRSDDFQQFSKEVALHIAATNPKWIAREDVPADVVAAETEIALSGVSLEGKSQAMVDKITAGKLSKFYKENCLLEQVFVKDPSLTINDLLGALVSKVGERVVVKRFVRFAVGG
jgi:elongation factor Ts